MKPMSIIFLAFALLMIIGGMIVCSMAKDAAEEEGISLFSETENGETCITQELADTVNKLELVFTDAEIHIYADTEITKSYVEFRNFREGLYTLSETSQIVSFDEMPNFNSLLHFNSGFSFNGLRGLFHDKVWKPSEKTKVINIYLAPENTLKILTVSCTSCTLDAKEIYNSFDLTIDAEDSTVLSLEHFRTNAALKLTAPAVQCSLEDGYLDTLMFACSSVDFSAKNLSLYHMEGTSEKGKVSISNPNGWDSYAFDLKGTKTASIGGTDRILPYNTVDPEMEKPDFSVTWEAGETEISLTYYDMYAG